MGILSKSLLCYFANQLAHHRTKVFKKRDRMRGNMSKKLLHTPDGVRDLYGNEFSRKLAIEQEIKACMQSYGYQEIQTPTFEYLDVYSKEIGTIPAKDMYKFFDREGNTLALRPDFTPSIARCVAKYFMDETNPIRLCYMGNTFTNSSLLQGKLKEVTEMGVELINDTSVEADAEMIKLVATSLKSCGLNHFKIIIGEAEYFNGICEQAGLDEDTINELRGYITDKNYMPVCEMLEQMNIPASHKEILKKLADITSDFSDFAAARKLADNPRSLAAVERLEKLSQALKDNDMEEFVSFDLSMVSKFSYYTGIIFKVFSYGVGSPIASGGRYDKLLQQFGKDAAAIGFVVIIDELMAALNRQDSEQNQYLTFALGKGRLAHKTLELLEQIGITCEEMKDKDSRKLIFVNEDLKVRFFLSKGPDVPTYVEYGAADIGVVGKDTIEEEQRNVCEVLDLGFGKCRMCVCGPASARELLKHHERIRVASKYPEMAKDYFYNKKHQTIDIIKLNGSVELGPIVELSDVIVDIVETGSTLRENGLEVLEEICPLSARVIVNPVSMQLQSARIKDLIAKIRDIINQ